MIPALPMASDWVEYRRAAAVRMIAANPGSTYTSKAPNPLLAIPVVEVHLLEDGSVERVLVVRSPSQARDTLGLVEEAIRRSGPFGSVAHLPKPWRFTEVFLFDHARRFKPMILDR
jgi:protein TonB